MSQFILKYHGVETLSTDAESAVTKALSGITIISRSSGTLLLDGDADSIEKAVGSFAQWKLSPVVKLSTGPVRRQIQTRSK